MTDNLEKQNSLAKHVRKPPLLVVALGEALYDRLPTQSVLGGASLNMAIHTNDLLQPIGGSCVVATRVGDDELGKKLMRQVGERGLDTDPIQVDPDAPTSEVIVTLDDQQNASYNIAEGVAWDFMQWSPGWKSLAEKCDAVCFGTLAQRSDTSGETIHRFLATAANALRLFDANLRQHYYNEAMIRHSLKVAHVCKLNSDELPEFHQMLLPTSPESSSTQQARELMNEFDLDLVALTQGSAGTLLITSDAQFDAEVPRYTPVEHADSVGAGDVTCGAIICGLLLGLPLSQTVSLANRLGSYVASQQGAIPVLPDELRKSLAL